MMTQIKVIPSALLIGLVVYFSMACSGGGPPTASTVTVYSYSGFLTDEDSEKPITDATITLNGVEAEVETDSEGFFTVTEISNESNQVLTVDVDGYDPVFAVIDVSEDLVVSETTSISKPVARSKGKKVRVRRNKVSTPLKMDIHHPQNKAKYCLSGSSTASVNVSGMVSLRKQVTAMKDVVLLIDVSGSTEELTNADIDGDNEFDRVIDLELAAAREFISQFDLTFARLGIVKFSRYTDDDGVVQSDRTRVVQALTQDADALETALSTISSEGVEGGTDLAAGIRLSTEALSDAGAIISIATGDDGTEVEVYAEKHIVVLTDGVPTLPYGSGLTQEAQDRVEALTAAQEARSANVFIHPVVILPEETNDQKFTTMPAIQAISQVRGKVKTLSRSNIEQLPATVASLPISGISSVTVEGGGNTVEATVGADGSFSAVVSLAEGNHDINLSAHGGNVDTKVTASRSVEVHTALLETEANLALTDKIVDMGGVQTPRGDLVQGSLYNLIASDYPNARLLPDIPTLTVGGSGQVTVDFIFREAGWNSEISYFVLPSASIPDSKETVLSSMTTSNSIIYMQGISNGSYAPGTHQTILNLTAGNIMGLMVSPKSQLSQSLNGSANKAPLFSIPSLNPGGYDQFVTIWDPDSSSLLIGIEDITLTANSDGDHDDIILKIEGASVKTLRCP